MSNLNKLLEIKQMLDSGVITLAEYNHLKNEILPNNSKDNQPVLTTSNSLDFTNISSVKESKISNNMKIFFIGTTVIIILFSLFYDKGLINLSSLHSINDRKLMNQQDVNEYALNEANSLCGSWKTACNHKNETERWEQQIYVDWLISNFEYTGLYRILQNNDLPKSYFEDAHSKFIKAIEACGWSSNRSKWPGQ